MTQTERVFLAHWTYSPEEWRAFMRWRKLKQGMLSYFIFRIFRRQAQQAPEIAITNQKVWIGDSVESFSSKERQLRKIHIREAGGLQVMEIMYEGPSGPSAVRGAIHIPIPKGKLTEAIEVHECLSANAW